MEAGKRFRARVELDDAAAYAYWFERDEEATVVAWYAPEDEEQQDDARHPVALRLGVDSVEVSDIGGRVETLALRGGSPPLTLTPSPVFVRGAVREVSAGKTAP